MRKRKKPSSTADSLVEEQLSHRLRQLEAEMDADAVAISGSMLYVMDDVVKEALESDRDTKRRRRLAVVLETDGGSIELVQRIVETMRHYYREVEFIVPNRAMSAGTVLALSGDRIWMNYYSVLGPIDPQIRTDNGFVPAIGYLEMYKRLVDKSTNGNISPAEMAFLLEKFDPAEMFLIEEHQKLSVTLLKEWLVRYKFKNWKQTVKRKLTVDRKMRKHRAEQIARSLSDPKSWHSHGRGISMTVMAKDVGVLIDDFDLKPRISEALKEYYDPLNHYLMRRGANGVVHVPGQLYPIHW